MTDEDALKISKVAVKSHQHAGHHDCLPPISESLVTFMALVSQRDVKSFKAGAGFFVTSPAASVCLALTRGKKLIDLLCSLIYSWDLLQIT